MTDTARAAGNLNAGERVDAAEAMILNALGGWHPLGVHDGWGRDVAKIIAVARQSFDLLRGIEPTELTPPPFNGFPDGIAWERARSYHQIELSNAVQVGDIDSALTLVGTWVARNMMGDLADQHQHDQNDDYLPHVIPEIAERATEVIAATTV
ncbi:hypothetical protein TRL7639_00479 [Falsiruegeria litorea R37]|uniref:Uncharacterized protein n=1 Tax=Falsiruegeria litorea R37 TaxID=1200284 RepID=A0A1Y5RL41_9RHOB|nr:hypothetical protein [Falsiruegeria litorea]SLN20057.1 hypothetical protein TRL7639_00479 [Falsiruegeria litorea R37]